MAIQITSNTANNSTRIAPAQSAESNHTPARSTTTAADFMARATIGPEFRQLLILYGRATDLSNDMFEFYLRARPSAYATDDCSAADIAEKLTAKINDVCTELLEQISEAICDKTNRNISGNDNCEL